MITIENHIDPTEEISLETVKEKAVKGVAALTGRTFILQAISLFATAFLGLYLKTEQYGVFFLVSAVVNFFAYFSDIGLAAALIQKKERLTTEDLHTTFTIQQTLAILLFLLILAITPFIEKFYQINKESVYLLWVLAFSLFLSSLKTIPSVLLERRLEFHKLIIPQILETLVFNSIAVYLAWRGFGIVSFTYAVLARGIVGLLSMYILQPWIPGLAFSKKSLKQLLKFGLPYQTNTFLAVIKDDGITIALGGILGASGIGLLGWAFKWINAPLRFFMDQVIKVTFPAFSRMQENKKELKYALEKSLFFVSLLVFPSVLGLILVSPLITEIITRYHQWQPALLAFGILGVNVFWGAVTTPLTNMLNAIGKIKITFKLMVMWTILNWFLVPFLASQFGLNGAAAGYSLAGTSSIIAIFIAHRNVSFNILDSVGKPFLATLVMSFPLFVVRHFLPQSLLSIAILIFLGLLIYGSTLYLLVGQAFISDTKRILKIFNVLK